MALLAAFQSVLHRYTGQDDILVGVPVANRLRPEVEDLIGCFINTLVMRGDLSGDPTFRQLVARTRQIAIDAQTHQDLPFEVMVDALKVRRSATQSPLFQAMLVVGGRPGVAGEARRFVGVAAFRGRSILRQVRADTRVAADAGGWRGNLEYRADLFEPIVAQGIADDFVAFLDAASSSPTAGWPTFRSPAPPLRAPYPGSRSSRLRRSRRRRPRPTNTPPPSSTG